MNTTLETIQDILRSAFDEPALIIDEKMTADDIDGWDSLTHVAMIRSVEDAFQIKISFTEMINFKNVGDLIHCVNAKTQNTQ